jgi:hypothetical protein
MADEVVHLAGVPVLLCAPGGPPLAGPQDALDVLGGAFYQAEVVAVPVERFDPAFFDLRTGLAGEIMQKFVNYHVRLVVVGDLGRYLGAHGETADALGDLIRESNRGRHVWFVEDLATLETKLRPAAG